MAQRRGRTEKFIDDIVQRVVENELGRAGRGCQSCLAPILDEQKCIFFLGRFGHRLLGRVGQICA